MLSTSLPQRVFTSLKELGIQLLPKEGYGASLPQVRLVVAFSGGMDSAMLLDTLAQLKSQFNLELYAAYYNHHWRPGAPKELPVLHKLTESLQIPLVMIEANRTLAKTETVARTHRYQALSRLAKDLGAQAVITAHHADDQIETVLFRILRGTGLDGLVGIQRALDFQMSRDESVRILRPLLGVAKADIVEYVKERQLRYYDDPSNQNTKIQRNLLRKKILPDLQQHFPHVKNALYKIALLAEGDHEILEKSLDDIWQKIYLSDEKGYYLDATVFNQLELPYQRRVLKRYLAQHQMEIDFQIIEDTLAFIRGEHRQDLSVGLKSIGSQKENQEKLYRTHTPCEKALGEHYFLSLYKNRLRILHLPESALSLPKTRQEGAASAWAVSIPGSVWSPELKINIEITPIPDELKTKLSKPAVLKASALLDPNVAYVDLSLFIDGPDKLEAPKPLELRTRRAGDKFFPMGMNAPMRLKKFLINKGIPRFERENIPMLASGEHILWIPGYGLSDYVKVSGKPTHRIQVEYCETEPPAVEISETAESLLLDEDVSENKVAIPPNIPDDEPVYSMAYAQSAPDDIVPLDDDDDDSDDTYDTLED